MYMIQSRRLNTSLHPVLQPLSLALLNLFHEETSSSSSSSIIYWVLRVDLHFKYITENKITENLQNTVYRMKKITMTSNNCLRVQG